MCELSPLRSLIDFCVRVGKGCKIDVLSVDKTRWHGKDSACCALKNEQKFFFKYPVQSSRRLIKIAPRKKNKIKKKKRAQKNSLFQQNQKKDRK
jgi:hypothetical protein